MFICEIVHVMKMRWEWKKNLENLQIYPLDKLDRDILDVSVAC